MRKAHGENVICREAAVQKKLELGLSSALLRRTYDDLILQPGITLAVIQMKLVRHESQGDRQRYRTFVAKEKE